MEAKRPEFRRVDRRDQHLLLARRDKRVGLGQPGKAGFTKQIGLGSNEAHSFGTVVTSPYVGNERRERRAQCAAVPSAKIANRGTPVHGEPSSAEYASLFRPTGDVVGSAAGGTNGYDGRRHPLTGGYRR